MGDGASALRTNLFVGREAELAELLHALDDATAGRGRLVLLAGEPGIGKSRLADEFAGQARDRGVAVRWGRCWEGGGSPPYWPWVQLLRSYVRGGDADVVVAQMGPGAADIAQMLPEIGEIVPDLPPPPSLDPDSARFQLFDSTVTFLRNASLGQPVVLVLDDLQSADTPSLLLLRFLASQLGDTRILVVATYRDVEVSPRHPLRPILAELIREPTTREIPLKGLEESEVARFIEGTGHVTPHLSLVSALHRETKGNPLFISEAVRLLASEGRLREAAEGPFLRLAVPAGVRDVIGRRIEHLRPECADSLTIASILGPEFTIEALRRLRDVSAEEQLAILDEAVLAGLLLEGPGVLGRFRFSHDLVRETFYEQVMPARRIRLHRAAGEALEAIYGSEAAPHLAELAHHFFEAAPGGDAARAVDYARLAGQQAARSLAYEEAIRLYRMAEQALDLVQDPGRLTRSELLLALGDAQARAGDLPAAQETLLVAAGIARKSGAADQLARAALIYGGRFVWARADWNPPLVPLLQDALILLGGSNDRLRVRLLARLAGALRSSPDRDRNAALSQEALEMARALDDPATLAYALDGRIWAIWWPENPEERLLLADELIRVAEAAREGERVLIGHFARYVALADLGRMTEAGAASEALAREAAELKQPAFAWLATMTKAQLALLRGSFDDAEALIDQDMRSGRATRRDAISAGRFHLFLLRREQGRVGEVEDENRASVEEFPWYPLHRAALILLLLDLGRSDEAHSMFEDAAASGLGELNRDNEWMLTMSLFAEACARLGEKGTSEELYGQLLPFTDRHAIGQGEGSLGAVSRYLGLLAESLGRREDAVLHLEHAVAFNERMGARTWAAHARHDLAGVLLARDEPGDREKAVGLLREAEEAARTIGMTALGRRVAAMLVDAGAAEAPAPSPGQVRPSVFRREGEYWSIAFEGRAFRLRDSRGLLYLARLLASPGRDIHALELVGGPAAAAKRPTEPGLTASRTSGAGEVLDPQAKAEYRRRIEELKAEIEEAEAWNDPERASRAKAELDFIVHELTAATGLGGRARQTASPAERARVSVNKAIKAALDRINEHSPALGRHLATTVHTGMLCSYTPDPRVPSSWHL